MTGPGFGAGTPAEHRGDLVGEQRALAAGRAVADLSDHGVVSVSGPDRLSWLDSLTTQSIARLAPGSSAETLLLDPSGRIERVIRVVDDGETAWLLVDPGEAEPLAAFLDRMRFMLRVEVADRSADFATIGTLGEAGTRIAAAAPNGVALRWQDPWTAVQAGGWQYALEAAHPGEEYAATHVLLERSRLDELAEEPEAGRLAWEALRIAAWRPSAAERDATTIPHELDWMRSAVHLAKGCYRGQETVAKVHNLGHPPRRLVLLHLDGSEGLLPEAGAEVRPADAAPDSAPVGRVTSVARHHEWGPLALAVVKRTLDETAALVVAAPEGVAPIAAAQQTIVPPSAGRVAEVPRMPRLGAVRR